MSSKLVILGFVEPMIGAESTTLSKLQGKGKALTEDLTRIRRDTLPTLVWHTQALPSKKDLPGFLRPPKIKERI